MKQKNQITEGVIWKQLLIFFFPIVIGTFFQQIYNTADSIVVGRFVGKEALAAVGGSVNQIVMLIVEVFVGLTSGASVIMAQFYGARDRQNLNKTLHTAYAFAIVTGAVVYIVIMVFGSMFMSVSTELAGIILSGVAAIIIGFVIEFFELGVDYSRTELTQFEDDEYIYYVKAVPKALVSESKKSVKKFTPNSKVVEEVRLDEVRQNKETKAYQQESQHQEIKPIPEENLSQTEKAHTQDFSAKQNTAQEESEAVPVERVAEEDFDFEKQLEESLKNL